MKCHYEVLNVPRDADDLEIKSAYRKLALKWHPDKNLDNSDYAKEEFQIVQQAYEVLSDRHERAWYDNHREQILRGSNSEYEDKSLDVFQYFTTSCFNGYSDDDKGFYAVYRNVFETIAKEEMEFVEEKEEFCKIPDFGDSQTSFDKVSEFYTYWLNYSTKKSYVWLDPYSISEIRSRRYLKLVEKENKKIRLKAKKERNEEIRNLVAFVRKRDKRVQAAKKVQEQKLLEDKKKRELLNKQKRLERQQELNESAIEPEWAKFENVQYQLEEIEKNLVEQFGEIFTESEDENEDFNNFYCVACNKTFKSPKAFGNHEISKKHRDNLELLRETMLKEDADFEKESNASGSILDNAEVLESDDELNEFLEENVEDENDIQSDSDSMEEMKKVKQKKKSKKSRTVLLPMEDIQHTNEEHKIVQEFDDDHSFKTDKKQRNKNKKKGVKQKSEQADVVEDIEKLVNENLGSPAEISNGKKKTKKKGTNASDTYNKDTDHNCVTCRSNFPSKNKLFEHLKKTGHGVYIPTGVKNKDKKNIKEK